MFGIQCTCGRRAVSHAADATAARAAFAKAGWLFTEGRDPNDTRRMSERATCPTCAAQLRAGVAAQRARYQANKESFT